MSQPAADQEPSALAPCPVCGHAQPRIYFGSGGACFDCIVGAAAASAAEAPLGPALEVDRAAAMLRLPARGDVDVARTAYPDRFAAAVAAMTDTQCRAFVGYFNEGLTLGSLAREQDVGTPAVSKALARAIDHLRRANLLPPSSPAAAPA